MGGHHWIALGASLTTSVIILGRRILVLNKFRWPPLPIYYIVLPMSLLSGVTFWITLHAIQRSLWLQLVAGFTSTFLGWASMVLIVNEDLTFPSKQQLASLAFYILQETSITIQARLILS